MSSACGNQLVAGLGGLSRSSDQKTVATRVLRLACEWSNSLERGDAAPTVHGNDYGLGLDCRALEDGHSGLHRRPFALTPGADGTNLTTMNVRCMLTTINVKS